VARRDDPVQVPRRRLERLQERLLNPARPIVCEIDDFDLPGFSAVAAEFGFQRYGYVVTPNVDHLLRYYDDLSFRALYQSAAYVLLDSRVVALAMRVLKHVRFAVCPGSDLTADLLERVASPTDRIVLVGGSDSHARAVAARFELADIRHHNPPMGFIGDAQATETCLRFIEEQSPFRFCFLAVGSPQQEVVAQRLQRRGKARGLVLCVGAALNFISGAERRAPRWLQLLALEWLYRLLQDPGRLAGRYLGRGPRIFGHLWHGRLALRSRRAPLPG
jgi:exopolysaccharide biosynthesis WecB/TagA/CpsF family protein